MTRRLDIVKLIAVALVAVAVLGVVTPVCAMPGCDDVAAGACTDFMPACDDCPDRILMKHTHDDAVGSATVPVEPPVAIAAVDALPEPATAGAAFTVPEATASPPPLDPLGVRLTI